jgi:hypothetical protein
MSEDTKDFTKDFEENPTKLVKILNDNSNQVEAILKLNKTETSENSEESEEKIKKLCNLWNIMNDTLTPEQSLLKLLSENTNFPNKYEVVMDFMTRYYYLATNVSIINMLLSKELKFPNKYELIMKTTNNFIDHVKHGSFIIILDKILFLNSTKQSCDWGLFEKIISTAFKINKIDTTVYLHKLPILSSYTQPDSEYFCGYIKIIKCVFDNAVDPDLQDIKDHECKMFIKRQILSLILLYFPSTYVIELKSLLQNKSTEVFTTEECVSLVSGYKSGRPWEYDKFSKLDTLRTTRYLIEKDVEWFYSLVANGFISVDIYEKTYLTYLKVFIDRCKSLNIGIHTSVECIIYVLDACYKYGGDYDYNYETGNKEILKFALSLGFFDDINSKGFLSDTSSHGILFIKYLMEQYLDKQDTYAIHGYTYNILRNLVQPPVEVPPPVEVLPPVEVPPPTKVQPPCNCLSVPPPTKVEKSRSKPKYFTEMIKKMFYKKRH